ncbi:hypothetical protein Zmor_010731 [Zophobas morio]|uniref:Uncharacterized protein n=1 Tax=Zophobas morio TaxID=2755281 RepID=A0AA38IS08_9CUCU|nr:hypothetical protein Zmor_010731 [Zophobas morio]
MKHTGKYPGLLPHVLRAISERKEGGGIKNMSHVENAIKRVRNGNPSKGIYSLRRRRRRKEGGGKRRRRRRRRASESTDATSIYSDGEMDDYTESDTDFSRSRSRSRTAEPSDRGRRRKRSGGRRRRRRRKHAE